MKNKKTTNMAGSLELNFYMEDSTPEEMDEIFDVIGESIAGILMDYQIMNTFDWQITQESHRVKNRVFALMGIEEQEESFTDTFKERVNSVKQYVLGNKLKRLRSQGASNDNITEG